MHDISTGFGTRVLHHCSVYLIHATFTSPICLIYAKIPKLPYQLHSCHHSVNSPFHLDLCHYSIVSSSNFCNNSVYLIPATNTSSLYIRLVLDTCTAHSPSFHSNFLSSLFSFPLPLVCYIIQILMISDKHIWAVGQGPSRIGSHTIFPGRVGWDRVRHTLPRQGGPR